MIEATSIPVEVIVMREPFAVVDIMSGATKAVLNYPFLMLGDRS